MSPSRLRIPSLVALLLLPATPGCHKEGSHAQLASPDRATSSQGTSPAELARATLEQQVAQVEADLDRATSEQEASQLRRRRLVLSVAIAEITRRIERGEDQAVDVDELLTGVELTVRRSRPVDPSKRAPLLRENGRAESKVAEPGRRRFGKQPVDKTTGRETAKSEAGKDGDAGGESAKRRRGKRKDKDRKGARDAILDGLDDDLAAGDENERGGVQKARVEDESRPRGLMRAVHSRIGAMESCLGSLEEDVRLNVTIRLDDRGSIKTAKVTGVAAGHAGCISRELRRVRVPDHDGGTRIVRFPLFFQPDS